MSRETFAYSIRSVIHSYDGAVVLDIPMLDIPSGQTCVLTGPNGSGKTTLLSIMALLLNPVSGSVLLHGKEAAGGDPKLRRMVTLVHQKPVLFSTTVRGNIGYGLHASGLSSKETRDRTGFFLEKMGLSDIADKHARKLSGGEAQRVVLARALVLKTPIVLLDEPTNSLDDAARPALHELLREAVLRGATLLIATHDPGFVTSLNPRILRMDRGRLLEPSNI